MLRYALALVAALFLTTSAYAADKGGPKAEPVDDLVQAVKGFKPFIAAYAGAATAYTKGDDASGNWASDGGFDAAALVGGAAGFTSKFTADGPWYWGIEISGERRMSQEDSAPISGLFKGGELKWTLGAAAILGVELGPKAKVYALVGYRKGWSEDIVTTANSYNMPTKGGPEAGLGLSYNFTKNLVWDINARMWFPDAESIMSKVTNEPVTFDSADLTVRTGLKFEF